MRTTGVYRRKRLSPNSDGIAAGLTFWYIAFFVQVCSVLISPKISVFSKTFFIFVTNYLIRIKL